MSYIRPMGETPEAQKETDPAKRADVVYKRSAQALIGFGLVSFALLTALDLYDHHKWNKRRRR